ncbi:Pentatricopeptide repeat-containing protein [Spatholobus suberectus]|nr:Pentatricopeptide repeat-containing protein [Spatholobus suberectus]
MEVTSMSEAVQLHAQVVKLGLRHNDASRNLSKLFTFAALSPLGDLNYAGLLLATNPALNSYYYNTLIRAFSHSPDPTHHFHALSLFLSMPHPPDNFTFPFLLKCCARSKLPRQGKQLHGLITKLGFGPDLYVQNALIHMYSDHPGAEKIFAKLDRVVDKLRKEGLVSIQLYPIKLIQKRYRRRRAPFILWKFFGQMLLAISRTACTWEWTLSNRKDCSSKVKPHVRGKSSLPDLENSC